MGFGFGVLGAPSAHRNNRNPFCYSQFLLAFPLPCPFLAKSYHSSKFVILRSSQSSHHMDVSFALGPKALISLTFHIQTVREVQNLRDVMNCIHAHFGIYCYSLSVSIVGYCQANHIYSILIHICRVLQSSHHMVR